MDANNTEQPRHCRLLQTIFAKGIELAQRTMAVKAAFYVAHNALQVILIFYYIFIVLILVLVYFF